MIPSLNAEVSALSNSARDHAVFSSVMVSGLLLGVSGSFCFFIFNAQLGVWMASYSYSLTPEGPWLLSGLGSHCIRYCLANEVGRVKMSLLQFQTAHICI